MKGEHLVANAAALMEAGRNDEALVLLGRVLLTRPAHPEALSLRGETLRRLHRFAEALEPLHTAIELEPHPIAALRSRGETYLAQHQWDLALLDFDRALSLDPNDAACRKGRGRVRLQLGEVDAAKGDFEHALRLEPKSAELLGLCAEARQRTGDFAGALEAFDRAIGEDESLPWLRARRGLLRSRLGELAGAIEDFSVVLAADKNDAWAFRQRGEAKRQLHRDAEAIEDLSESLALIPDNAWAYASRGAAKARLGHHREAWADLTHSLARDADNVWARFQRASVLAKLGRHAEATADLDLVLSTGEHPQARRLRAESHFALRRLSAALTDADAALAQVSAASTPHADLDAAETSVHEVPQGELFALYCLRGEILGKQGDYAAAVTSFDEALSVKSDAAHARLRRGVMARCAGQHGTALSDLSAAFEAGQSEALLERSRLHELTGRLKDAEDDVTRYGALVGEPRPDEVGEGKDWLQFRARLRESRGDLARAAEDLSLSLKLRLGAKSPEEGSADEHMDDGKARRPLASYEDPMTAAEVRDETNGVRKTLLKLYLELGRFSDALPLFEPIAHHSGWTGELYALRGKTYLGYQNLSAAEDDFSAAIEAGCEEGYVLRGRLRAARSQFAEAAKDFEASLESAARHEALLGLALSKVGLGDGDALECVLAAMEVHGETPRLLVARAEAKMIGALVRGRASQDAQGEIGEDLNRALAFETDAAPSGTSSSNDVEEQSELGLQAHVAAALRHADRAHALRLRGTLQSAAGRHALAASDYLGASALLSSSLASKLTRYRGILALLQAGDHAAAALAAAEFAEADPSAASALGKGATAFVEADYDEARAHFQQALARARALTGQSSAEHHHRHNMPEGPSGEADRTMTLLPSLVALNLTEEARALATLLLQRTSPNERMHARSLIRAHCTVLGATKPEAAQESLSGSNFQASQHTSAAYCMLDLFG